MAKTQRMVPPSSSAAELGVAACDRLAKRQRTAFTSPLLTRTRPAIWKPLLHEVAGSMYPSTDEVDYLALASLAWVHLCHGASKG